MKKYTAFEKETAMQEYLHCVIERELKPEVITKLKKMKIKPSEFLQWAHDMDQLFVYH